MSRAPSRVDVAVLESATIREALEAVAGLLGTTPERVGLRCRAAAGFLEMVQAARAVADYRAQGLTLEAALSAAAAELGLPIDTLRTRLRDWKRQATGNAPAERVKSNPDTLPRAA